MSYTISITREGLVFDLITASDPDVKGPPVAIFMGTEDLANKIDKMAQARRPIQKVVSKEDVQDPGAATPGPFNDPNLDRISCDTPSVSNDVLQRMIELSLVASLTFLGALYFL